MKIRSFVAPAIIGFVLLLTQGIGVQAAEVKVIADGAFAPALEELGPQFERTTGHKLVIQNGILGTIKRQIEGGEEFDFVIVPATLLDDVAKLGKIAAGTRTEIARVGMAVAVRTGTPKPDISSVDAFKRTLLNAKSVTYPPEGAIGVHLAKVFDRLGIVTLQEFDIRYVDEKLAFAVKLGERRVLVFLLQHVIEAEALSEFYSHSVARLRFSRASVILSILRKPPPRHPPSFR
ncbi:MAG: substrate-binding domain-containing protein [Pseudomonadota bacterium]